MYVIHLRTLQSKFHSMTTSQHCSACLTVSRDLLFTSINRRSLLWVTVCCKVQDRSMKHLVVPLRKAGCSFEGPGKGLRRQKYTIHPSHQEIGRCRTQRWICGLHRMHVTKHASWRGGGPRWLWKLGQTSPEVKNIRGPSKGQMPYKTRSKTIPTFLSPSVLSRSRDNGLQTNLRIV